MAKEKRKGNPSKKRLKFIILSALILISFLSCWLFFNAAKGRSLSELSQFNSEEEVVAFLHEHFDLYVTTSEDILTFMEQYPLEGGECWNTEPTRRDFIDGVVHENIDFIMTCDVLSWTYIAGTRSYLIRFYITNDDLLEYIEAYWRCRCL